MVNKSLLLLCLLSNGCGNDKKSWNIDKSETSPHSLPLSFAATGCQASECTAQITVSEPVMLYCSLSAEGIAKDTQNREYTIWSKETDNIPFAFGVPSGLNLDFSESIKLIENATLVKLTGEWVSRCHSKLSDAEKDFGPQDSNSLGSLNVDKEKFYSLGEVKGWTTQALWTKQNMQCKENPALPDSREMTLPVKTAVWVNRLKPNFYFIDGANKPWIWVNIPGNNDQCYVMAQRDLLSFTNLQPPPPFKEFSASCEATIVLESGDYLRFNYPDLVITEKNGEISFSDALVIQNTTTLFDYELFNPQELRIKGLSNLRPVHRRISELPTNLNLDLQGVSRILEVLNVSGFSSGKIHLVIENVLFSREKIQDDQFPRFQFYVLRENNYPPLVSSLGKCRKLDQ